MLRLYYDENNIVRLASTKPIFTNIYKCITVDDSVTNPIGKKIVFSGATAPEGFRVAVICNWDSACGIATYAKYLVDALGPKVDALKIFSERTDKEKLDTAYDVSYCWNRGESMRGAVAEIKAWQPSVVLIQHEYGIFPKTSYMLQMLNGLSDIPYAVTMHSVYEHLDKTVASSSMRNIIVHSETGRECLTRLGNKANLFVIPHGCVSVTDNTELWNTWQTEYPIMQFGFGFNYKGVDIALEAIDLLKKKHGAKYQNVFYTYFCSESPHVKNVNDNYAQKIQSKIEELGLEDNATIVRGFQNESTLNNCLRTSRLAIFPYMTDPKNVVYGASGAIRLAMANGVPVIASSSHMFDDIEGVLPRPKNAEELTQEIDYTFSNGVYRDSLLTRSGKYIQDNSWDKTADRYVQVLQGLTKKAEEGVIYI